MKILFTICGRAGSKGIKNKNIRCLLGKPLPYYAISAIDLYLKNTDLDLEYDIVASSDSLELLKLVENNPMRFVECIVRDSKLCGDSVGKIDAIHDCLIRMEEKRAYTYDMVVDFDITSPLRTVMDIQNLIQKHKFKNADVTFSVTSARRNPYFNQVKTTQHGYKRAVDSSYTARQQAPEVLDMNGSLYAYSPQYLKTGKGVLDGYCECIKMRDTGVLDLDHENDFELMEVIAGYLFHKFPDFAEIYENI